MKNPSYLNKKQDPMKLTSLLSLLLSLSSLVYGQQTETLTTIDFVQILNENKAEAVFYYENNWKLLREEAVKKGYIQSYEVLQTPYSEEAPFHLMLITSYENEEQYNLREEHFGKLIEVRGELTLLNDKQPGEFRKSVFAKEKVRHWDLDK